MASCANGASVAPNWTAENVALSTVGAEIATAAGFPELVPFLLAEPIIGTIAANALCALNPDDPGDFQINMLQTPVTPDNPIIPTAPLGSMSRWIWDKTVYFFFQKACVCNVSNTPPPTPIKITPITNYDTTVNLAYNQSQLDVVVNNQQTGADGQKELYNGLQHVSSLVGDLWVRNVPNLMDNPTVLALSQVGEGALTLPIQSYPPGEYFSTGVTFIRCRVDQLGPRVGVRGTRNPRLYGVGSIFFEYDGQGGAYTTTFGRTSIHYADHTIPVPPSQMAMRLAWRLMPGNVVSFFAITPSTDNVQMSPTADTTPGWLPFGNYKPPANWGDPPIYPYPARRIFPVAGGSGDYLRLDSRPLAVPEQILTDVRADPKGCGCPGGV